MRESILSIKNLHVEYYTPRGSVKAVRNVNLDIYEKDVVFIVGESGAGKSTLVHAILQLLPPKTSSVRGEAIYRKDGQEIDILKLKGNKLRRFRWKEISMVFQGAMNSLNPVLRIKDQLHAIMADHGVSMSREEAYKRMYELLEVVRLDAPRVLNSYPHELSGGMKQRVMIAAALLLNPRIVILDEPTTALDVLIQRSIIDLLVELHKKYGLTMIFITHDLSLAATLADRIAVMYAGTIVEVGTYEQIFYRPKHPYTIGLLRSIPKITDERIESIPGSPPDMINLPSGCKFHPRCKYKVDKCIKEEPKLEMVEENHYVACWRWREIQ